MTYKLTAQEQPLAKIFSDDYVFTIPGYQRPYSWGTEQADELLNDLLSALENAPHQLYETAPYFLGSIVLIKKETSPEATVVDGQQRLTTLTILLSAIRAAVNDSDMRADITNCIYEKGNLAKGTQARYRLSLRERDRDFFRRYIQHESGFHELITLSTTLSNAQTLLKNNAANFKEKISTLTQNELTRLIQFIITRCYLVTVATPDLDSAYRIFGVLNSRGLDLSTTDILKAEIIGSINNELRDSYTKKWEDEEENLGRDQFNGLFSHIRMVFRKTKPQDTLLREFRWHVESDKNPQHFIDNVLLPMAQAFSQINHADYSCSKLDTEINEHLYWLNRLEFKDWVPPSLAFFIRYQNKPELILRFFCDLERLAYSMLIRKSNINERIGRLSTLTSFIENNENLYDEHSPLQLTSLEQHETYSVLDGSLYENHSSRSVATLMLRLDRIISDRAAIYQHDIVSVEHVMPQHPKQDSQWEHWIPDLLNRQKWVHRLGNLTLLSRRKNSAANNYEFEKKKSVYFTKEGISSFAITTNVLNHHEWTESILEKRQAYLLNTLEKHWRLQNRKSKIELAKAETVIKDL